MAVVAVRPRAARGSAHSAFRAITAVSRAARSAPAAMAWERRYRNWVIGSDIVVTVVVVTASGVLIGGVGRFDEPHAAATAAAVLLALSTCRAWSQQGSVRAPRSSAGVGAALIVAFGGLLAGALEVKPWVFSVVPAVAAAIFPARYALRRLLHRARRHGQCLLPVMAAGNPTPCGNWWSPPCSWRSPVRLVLAAPALLLIALAIKVGDPGPVVYRQRRVGTDGDTFTMLKFRTMVVDADAVRKDLLAHNEGSGPLFKIRDDPRVTAVGGLLRRYSVDEFPQLVNVLAGQTSLVGPRPPLPEETERYEPEARRRLLVKPGLTGLWQVSGRSELSWEGRRSTRPSLCGGLVARAGPGDPVEDAAGRRLRSRRVLSGELAGRNGELAGGSGGLAGGSGGLAGGSGGLAGGG
ncbi:lipopolysaccharide/colanic/teichoic acid biosynthesis glycosyltransferase [Saccharomonospora amisosensis]|uniref:Lipopolysaccharide/colanic/teichoic acid biosynthesis glycosyltransferase n=1 Tax=Saccharomonospora amisosensis TaxID=1128677 RepID=A0A7X5UP36_9PSEU|nr:lipopolysaccharide/colanic/teichoic acid biosynthesis glycosyltransferase [Saccharomonospora amisosensis]